jgi:hypothetical protein
MTPQGLLLHSHMLSSGLYSEPQESTPHPSIWLRINFYIALLFMSASCEWSSVVFLTKVLYGFMFFTVLATCYAPLFLRCHNWQEYKS